MCPLQADVVGGHVLAQALGWNCGAHPQQDAQCAIELRRADLDLVAEHRAYQLGQSRGRL